MKSQLADSTCQQSTSRVIDYGDGELRVPRWVQARVATLGRHFTGKITLNVRAGGIANFQVEPSGGDRLTFHPKN